jgi:hypothetical protein
MDIMPVFGTVVGGSNPSGRTFGEIIVLIYNIPNCGRSLVVKYDLAKIKSRVRFPVPAQRKSLLISPFYNMASLLTFIPKLWITLWTMFIRQ